MLTTDQRRGAETSAVALRDELRLRGHDASAVALVSSGQDRTLDVPTLGTRHRLSPGVLADLRRRAKVADVVIAHGSTTLPACAVALSGRHSPPFVYANIGDVSYWANSRRRRLGVRLLLRRASAIAARSTASAEMLSARFGVPRERLAVVPNGRDIERFTPPSGPARLVARRALRLDEDRPVVAIVGALAPEKRVDLALRAVALLPGTTLLIAGEGPDRPALEHAARTCEADVRFLGQVDDVPRLLGAVDALLLTSDSEGLPGVLVEAGLMSLPVVTTDVGFVRDIVLDDVTGFVVPRDDPRAAAAALRSALDRRHELGARARERCLRNFDMAQVAAQWEALLSTAVRGDGSWRGHG